MERFTVQDNPIIKFEMILIIETIIRHKHNTANNLDSMLILRSLMFKKSMFFSINYNVCAQR